MIRVMKRDGSREPFSPRKLAGAMWRAMRPCGGRYGDAWRLATAIGIYLRRIGWRRLSSAAVFEMALKVLRRTHLRAAAEAMEEHRAERRLGRLRIRVHHAGRHITLWDKSWVAQLAQRSWFLSPATGRILAGQIEDDLLARGREAVSRQDIMAMLNRLVEEYGLADAVPVPSPAAAE